MFIVHSTFPVPDKKADEVINIYKNRSRLVDKTMALSVSCCSKMKKTKEKSRFNWNGKQKRIT